MTETFFWSIFFILTSDYTWFRVFHKNMNSFIYKICTLGFGFSLFWFKLEIFALLLAFWKKFVCLENVKKNLMKTHGNSKKKLFSLPNVAPSKAESKCSVPWCAGWLNWQTLVPARHFRGWRLAQPFAHLSPRTPQHITSLATQILTNFCPFPYKHNRIIFKYAQSTVIVKNL